MTIEEKITQLYLLYGNDKKIMQIKDNLYAFVSKNSTYRFININTMEILDEYCSINRILDNNILIGTLCNNSRTKESLFLNIETFDKTILNGIIYRCNNVFYTIYNNKLVLYNMDLEQIKITEISCCTGIMHCIVEDGLYLLKTVERNGKDKVTKMIILRYNLENNMMEIIGTFDKYRIQFITKTLVIFTELEDGQNKIVVDFYKIWSLDSQEIHKFNSLCI